MAYASNYEGLQQVRSEDDVVSTEHIFYMPLTMTEQYWRRFGFTLGDIKTTLSEFDRSLIYKLALLYGITPPMSGMRVSFGQSTSMIYEHRVNMVQEVLDRLIGFEEGDNRAINLDVCNHRPHIPSVRVTTPTYQRNIMAMPKDWNPTVPQEYMHTWTYKDIQMVPLYERTYMKSKQAICMHRIILKSVYEESGKPIDSFMNRPAEAIVAGKEYFITGEACWIIC